MHFCSTNKIKLALLMLLSMLFTGCAGWQPGEAARTDQEARRAIVKFRKQDPSIRTFFERAYAYAVFPEVGKGGIGIGGAYGSGVVYRHGKMIGLSKLSQVTIGFQLGGESYSEIIFFENARALESFKSGNLKFSAQASAVAATAGAAAKTSYADNMAVFVLVRAGLMYEASVGGQTFSFDPVK